MVHFWYPKLVICTLLISMLIPASSYPVSANPMFPLERFSSASQPSEVSQAITSSGFTLISSTSAGIVLELHAPTIKFESVTRGDYSCQNLRAEGYYQASSPGEPAFLSNGFLLGIPLNSTPTLVIQSIEYVTLPEKVHLCPVATPQIQTELDELPVNMGEVLYENTPAYSQDTFLPARPIEFFTSGMIRSQWIGQLRFTPFQYNPVKNELKAVQYAKVEIQFGKDGLFQEPSTLVDEGLFEPVLQKILINYDQSRFWRSPRESMASSQVSPTAPQLVSQSQYKILVDQDGIYQVSYEALQLAGVPVGELDPRTFRLVNHGTEVPIFIVGNADEEFKPGDYLLFYGQKISTKYTQTNVYWLSWGGETGLRMLTIDGSVNDASSPVSFNSRVHIEENHIYVNSVPSGPQNDHWYWYYLNATSEVNSHDFTFSIQDLASGATSARLSGLLKGYNASPYQHTLINLNGHQVDDHTWPSTDEYQFSIEFSSDLLVTGVNTITVQCPLDGVSLDQLFVNWFELDYSRTFTAENDILDFYITRPGIWQFQVGGFISDTIDVFDITDPLAPSRIISGTVQLNGARHQINFERPNESTSHYLTLSPSSRLAPLSISLDIASNLKEISNAADYIIISPSDFIDAIQPLADYRASQGLSVKVVDVQDVYDEFSGGIFDPQAIHDFLAYAYASWSYPAPAYVLLVGDGHFDFLDYYGGSGPEYIPPYLGEFDPWIGETASDNRYVTVSGEDILPDMFIGRLPVNNVDETIAMVNKILAYEQSPIQGDWNNRLTFIADNADAAGNFPVLSDKIANHFLPDEYTADKIYYGLDPYTAVPDARTALIDAINQGRLMVNFVGHGSVQFWAAENLLHINNIVLLNNLGKYPFFFPMTCAEGYFIFPNAEGHNLPSLAESLVRAGDKGAIASFSPSGFGLSTGHDLLAQGLYQAFFRDGLTQFGPASTFAKDFLYANSSGFRDLLDTYNLFGDPAVRLKVPAPYSISLPLVIR